MRLPLNRQQNAGAERPRATGRIGKRQKQFCG
jgi:hypothetical protein